MTRLVPTDMTAGGEPLYVALRKPNWFRYQWRTIKLFIGLVPHIGIATAWSVSVGLHDYQHDLKAWKAGKEISAKP